MNHAGVIEGFEVAIAMLLEKVSTSEFYAKIYFEVPLPLRSTANDLQPQSLPESALSEFYAAVIVFVVKAREYFQARGTHVLYDGLL